jgi:hypothetical protein
MNQAIDAVLTVLAIGLLLALLLTRLIGGLLYEVQPPPIHWRSEEPQSCSWPSPFLPSPFLHGGPAR